MAYDTTTPLRTPTWNAPTQIQEPYQMQPAPGMGRLPTGMFGGNTTAMPPTMQPAPGMRPPPQMPGPMMGGQGVPFGGSPGQSLQNIPPQVLAAILARRQAMGGQGYGQGVAFPGQGMPTAPGGPSPQPQMPQWAGGFYPMGRPPGR